MGRKKKEQSNILTETELRIMNIIWKTQPATVHQVLELLPGDYAYNTVSTIIRVLEQKDFIKSEKEGRSHLYSAKMTKEEYEKVGLNNIVEGLFDGAPMALVKRLIGSGKLSDSDVGELKELLADKDRK